MKKKAKAVWAMALSVALATAQLPAMTLTTLANEIPDEDSMYFSDETGSGGLTDQCIVSFAALDARVARQTVPAGTEESELDLPQLVKAKIHGTEEVDIPDEEILEEGEQPEEDPETATPAFARESRGSDSVSAQAVKTAVSSSWEMVPVTWDSDPAYDPDTPGDYFFTADTGYYPLLDSVKPLEIRVTVKQSGSGLLSEGKDTHGLPSNELHENTLVKNISSWEFEENGFLSQGELAIPAVTIDNPADFDTVVSMLPAQILAEVDDGGSTAIGQEGFNAETVEISSWNCPEYREDQQGNWPVSGEYTFTAELESGYRCNPLPSVKVLLGGASLFTINDRFVVDGLLYKELGPDTVQLMGYDWDKPKGELHIPSQVVKPENGRSYKVVSIGPWAFDYCRELTGSLVIPDTVTKIGKSAFSWCSFDGALILPEGLTEIGDSAFYHSSFTGTLNLPDSLTEIGSLAFNECPGFTGPLVIPKQITVIQKGTFMACSGFESLTLPEGLIEIRNMGFTSLSSVKTPIIFPASLTLIGNSAFSGVSSCPEFICPTLTIADLLYECGSYIPNFSIKVGEVRYDQLQNKDSFKIGSNPAMNYVITGPDTVTAAGPGNVALYGILDIPQEVTNPADNITYTVTAIGDGAFRTQYITEVRIPDTVTKIGTGAFTVCENLTGTLELPAGLTSIGDAAFSRCTITGPLVIPDTVTEIGSDAFSSCQSIDSLTLPPGLTEIRERTFAYCYDLTGTLSLPPALTRIGSGAFTGCRNLSGPLNLPSGLTHIGEMAFSDCWSLTEAFLDKNITFIGWCAFNPNLPLTTNSPRVQLLINEYIIRANPVDTFWDGGEDIPDGALVTVNQDVTLDQDRRVGREAEITVDQNAVLTVNGALVMDGHININGRLIINGPLTGSGTLYIGKYGRVIGDISGFRVEYEPIPSSGGNGTYIHPNIQKGTWERTDAGHWKYRQPSGAYSASRWELVDGLWYWFDGEGRMLTGWQLIDRQWYYLCKEEDTKTLTGMKEGARITGWYYDLFYGKWFYFDENGVMVTGWREIDGIRYYFNPESDGTMGAMITQES